MSYILFKLLHKDVVHIIQDYEYRYYHSLIIAEIESNYVHIRKHFDYSKYYNHYCTDDDNYAKYSTYVRGLLNGCHDCSKISYESYNNGSQVLYYKCAYTKSNKIKKGKIDLEYNGKYLHTDVFDLENY